MVGGTLETGRERPIEEEIVMSIDGHLVLELAERKEGGGRRFLSSG